MVEFGFGGRSLRLSPSLDPIQSHDDRAIRGGGFGRSKTVSSGPRIRSEIPEGGRGHGVASVHVHSRPLVFRDGARACPNASCWIGWAAVSRRHKCARTRTSHRTSERTWSLPTSDPVGLSASGASIDCHRILRSSGNRSIVGCRIVQACVVRAPFDTWSIRPSSRQPSWNDRCCPVLRCSPPPRYDGVPTHRNPAVVNT